jgi:diguanylate cyclase (GGDEF)-like protein/PAS domain S-box-containing protein
MVDQDSALDAETDDPNDEFSYRRLVENQPNPICRFRRDFTLTFVNRAYADLFRRTPGDLAGRRLSDVLSEEDASAVVAHLASLTADKPSAQYEHRNVRRSGKVRWHLWNTLAFFDDDGNVISCQAIGTDITLRKEAEEEILREKEKVENCLAIAANMFVALDAEGRITLANEKACKVLGRPRDELIGENWFETAIPMDQRQRTLAEFQRIMRGDIRPSEHGESFVATRSDQQRLIAWRTTALEDADGRVTGTLSCGEDITERKQAEEKLHTLSSAVEHSPSSIIITDANATIEYVNPTFTQISGYTLQDVIGQNARILKSGLVPDEVYRDLWQTIHAGKIWQGELCNKKKNDGLYWDLLAIAPVKDTGGNITHFIATQHEITEQKLLVRQMAYDATHDALTDLVNRREFERRLERAIASTKEHGSHHVLCFLDLDQFKLINDTAGHAAGDELLKQVRGLLKGKFRGRDTLARLGGDEFGLLLDNCTLERANKINEMVIANLRDYRFFWEGRSFRIGVSIGLVAITAETESTAQAMAQADVACYAAKERGRNRVRVYQPEGAGPARHHSEIVRAATLRTAVEEDRFCLYCQPIVPLSGAGDALVRYEILVRMIDADGQLILPRTFIPAAERYGLMGAIDRWVIRHAFRHCARTFGQSSRIEFAINLSGDSLNDDSFPDFMREQFARSGVPAERICFEISETAAIRNINHVTQVISEIRKKGSRFALDDFGIGLSSFDYLKTLPVDYVKIDGRFVRDMVENAVDHAMVSAINEVGHVMGIETIAEFAHNKAILERLSRLGVDYAQGYAIGAPIPLASIDGGPRPGLPGIDAEVHRRREPRFGRPETPFQAAKYMPNRR